MAADLVIDRKRPTGRNGWKNGRDVFKIPSSLWGETYNCTSFDAEVTDNACTCLCPKKSATFVFHNETNGCQENVKVRNLLAQGDQGTPVYFSGERVDSEMRMLTVGDNRRRVKLDEDNGNCAVDSQSIYFGCGGAEHILPSGHPFKLKKNDEDYFLEVMGETNFDSLKGRIIKLKIECHKRSRTESFVLVFKYEGSRNCTILKPTSQPPATTKPLDTSSLSSPSLRTSTSEHAASTITETSPSTSHIPPKVPFTVPVVTDLSRTSSFTLLTTSEVTKVSKVRPNVSEAPSTTLAKRLTTTDSPSKSPVVARPDPGQERRTDGKSSPLALIAGVTVAIAILVILTIIAFLTYRHRHSVDKSNSGIESEEKKKTAMRSLTRIRSDVRDNEDHYKTLTLREPVVYASGYQAPVRVGEANLGNSRESEVDFYAPLNIPDRKNIYGHINNQETVFKDMRPKINGPISVNQRVYDLMEEIAMDPPVGPTEEGENGAEPVYNALVGSFLDGSQSPKLNGPISVNQRVYDLMEEMVMVPLKGPAECGESGTEPVYNVLEGSVFGEVDGPRSPAFFDITSDSTEGLVYHYVEKGNHPMSKVLKETSLNGAEKSNHHAATGLMEPVYNTLEAHVSDNDGDPVYNVLEVTENEGGPRHHIAIFTEETIHPSL
ncbi:hypothetical protein AWC38_SpisGene18355 [Stylophora pistillata]|uniref:Uncharacterized protein n=2 Tax=Stylophora pistillata TaxID=50429 RepID=A0A2B4RJG9_STYPI|nr:hypothetical protein AWC38_SpisGene18355 [Stylophora pistillata]